MREEFPQQIKRFYAPYYEKWKEAAEAVVGKCYTLGQALEMKEMYQRELTAVAEAKRGLRKGENLIDGILSGKSRVRAVEIALGNTWQHPKIPILKPLNIAEAPKNAASALLKASLGEDKYLILSFAYNPIIALRKKFIHRTSKKNLLFHENIIY